MTDTIVPTESILRPNAQFTLVSPPDPKLKSNYATWHYSILVPERWRYDPENEFKLTYRIHTSFTDDQVDIINNAIEHLSHSIWPELGGWGATTDYRAADMPFYDQRLFEEIDAAGDDIGLNYACFLAFWHYPNHEDDVLRNKHNLLVIDRFDEEPTADGIWTLGVAEVNAFHILRHCHINLNGTAIGTSSKYYKATDPKDWAVTILHECLHNFGWRHQESATNAIMVKYSERVREGLGLQ